jgi:hypothetical protein
VSAPWKPTEHAAAAAALELLPLERERYADGTTAALRELAHELLDEMIETQIPAWRANLPIVDDSVAQPLWTKLFLREELIREVRLALGKYVVEGREPIEGIAATAYQSPSYRAVVERLGVKMKRPRRFVAAAWAKHNKPDAGGRS